MSILKVVSFREHQDEQVIALKKKNIISWQDLEQTLSVMVSPSVVVYDPLNVSFVSKSYLHENNNSVMYTRSSLKLYRRELERKIGLKPGVIDEYSVPLSTIIYMIGVYAQSFAIDLAQSFGGVDPVENYLQLSRKGALSLLPRFYLKREGYINK